LDLQDETARHQATIGTGTRLNSIAWMTGNRK